MRRQNHSASVQAADVIFQPALTPLEAAMLPAQAKPGTGALHLAQAAWRPGGTALKNGARQPKLTRWGVQRTKI